MNCTKWQELILLRASGELSGRKLRGLERHLEECGECRGFAEEYVAASRALESVPLEEPSGGAVARLRRAMEGQRRRSPVLILMPRVAVGVAAAAVVAIVLIVSSGREPVSPGEGLIAVLPEGVVEDAKIEGMLAAVSEEVELLGDDVAFSSPAAIGEELDEVEEMLDRMKVLLEET